jgi:hypothetical protein
MSHLLCGKFVFKRPLPFESQTEFSFKLVEFAFSERLGLQLGCNIVQEIVFEMLRIERSHPNHEELPFLITDSPIADTSDNLIAPDVSAELSDSSDTELNQNLERVRQFLMLVGETGQVFSATILFSEGYDDSFEEIHSSVTLFAEHSLKAFHGRERVPSLKVMVTF